MCMRLRLRLCLRMRARACVCVHADSARVAGSVCLPFVHHERFMPSEDAHTEKHLPPACHSARAARNAFSQTGVCVCVWTRGCRAGTRASAHTAPRGSHVIILRIPHCARARAAEKEEVGDRTPAGVQPFRARGYGPPQCGRLGSGAPQCERLRAT
ncbi:hypothetical protein EON67_06610 [archaeon]|nr:MAG: hypothetical protein EON67_06610 [archaeon]